MKTERARFAERLRRGLIAAKFDTRPKELVKLLAAYGRVSVTPQTISGWLSGKYLPRQDKMRALAHLIGITPEELQYGRNSGLEVRESRHAWPDRVSGRDRLMFENYLALPAAQRETVRQMVAALSAPAQKPR